MVLLPLPWFCCVLFFGYPYEPAEENKIGTRLVLLLAKHMRMPRDWTISGA